MKYIQESSYVRLAPSLVAKPSKFRSLQNNEAGRILNDRPYKDVQITPIALLYAPFGEFLDHIRNPPMDSDTVNLAKLEASVNEFSLLMCQHYSEEVTRRDTILKALNSIFECYLPSKLTHMIPSAIMANRFSDGHACGPANVLETIVEFKNELGSATADPEIQIAAYYTQSIKNERDQGQEKETIIKSFLFPALGISIIGKGHKLALFEILVVIAHARFFLQVPILDSVLSYFSANPDSSDSRRYSPLAPLLATIPTHYSMHSGLPVCCVPVSAETLSKQWIVRLSRLEGIALMFIQYQCGRQMPTLESSTSNSPLRAL